LVRAYSHLILLVRSYSLCSIILVVVLVSSNHDKNYYGKEGLSYFTWQHKIVPFFYSHTCILLFFQEKPVFTFANEMGINMLETSLVALQDLSLDKIFDDAGRKALFSEIPKLMEQVFNCFFQAMKQNYKIT
jgi:hypothetical protein